MYFALSPKYSLSSFVGSTSGAQNFRRPGLLASSLSRPRKPPEVTRRSTMRRAGATWRLQSFCFQTGLLWTPRTTKARGLKAGSRARIPSPAWGTSERFFAGIEIWEKCLHFQQVFGKVLSFQCNMPIMCGKRMIWLADGTQIARWPTFKNAAKPEASSGIPYPTGHPYNEYVLSLRKGLRLH